MSSLRSAMRSTSLASSSKAMFRPQPVLRRAGAVRSITTRETQLRDKAYTGPFSWKAAVLFVGTGAGLWWYFESEKERLQKEKRQAANESVGRPSIGGPFSLLDTNNKPFTNEDLLGKWTLLYFGFTHCPDICPEELDKMGDAVDMLEKDVGEGTVLPVFFSVDPARDSVEQVKRYLTEFHPRMVGLTGDYDAIKRACRSYRVYFSTPPDAKPTDDYLVDHSIFFYLMDPLGQFVEAFGKATTAQEVANKTKDAMKKWEKAGGNVAAGISKP